MQYRNLDKQAIKENAYTVLSKISIVGTNIVLTENDSIISWEYEDYRYVPDNGFVGQFVERLLDGNLRDVPDGVILEDTEINLQLGIVNGIDNQTTWYDYGNFLITKVGKEDTTGNYKFESADYTKKFNQVFNGDYTNTTYTKSFNQKIEDEETVTALWLAQYACAQAGVVLYTTNFTNYNFAITSNQYDSEDTLRKVMQDIGKLAYSWVRVGTDNKVHIDFTPKTTSSVDTYNTLTTDEYYVSKKSDLAFGPVNKVLIGMSAVDGENMYETSSSYTPETECAIKIWDNNITNTQELRALALNGCDRLFGITYTPIEIESIGHPWLEGDDLIKLTNVDNEVIYTYAFNRKLEYAGYIEGTISSEAATAISNKYEYKSDIINSVKRTTIEVDKQNQTITALAENVSDNTSDISQLQIDVNGIDLRVQSVENTEVVSVTNEYAKNTSATTPPAQSSSSWSTTTPTRGEGEYIWARIKTTYKSGTSTYSNPVNTTGDKGDPGQGSDGASIDEIIEYYAVSDKNDVVPSSWTTDLSSITLTPENKYLWNYTVTTYTQGKPSTGGVENAKVIGVYGDSAEQAVMYHNATGTSIDTEDAGNLELKAVNELSGDTTQDGTPTPDTPIPIEVTTGKQDINVSGKNLLNVNKIEKGRINITTGEIQYADRTTSLVITENSVSFTQSSAWLGGIASEFIPVSNTTYRLSFTSDKRVYVYVDIYDRNKNYLGRILSNYSTANVQYNQNITITDNNVKYLRQHFEVNTAGTYVVTNWQLEKGNTTTTYEPYKGKTYEINLGKNLLDYTQTYATPTNSSVDDEGWITATYNNTSSSTKYCNYYTKIPTGITIKPSSTYYVFLEVKSVSYTTENDNISITNTNASFISNTTLTGIKLSTLSNNGVYKYTLTTKSNLTGIMGLLRTLVSVESGNSVSITYRLTLTESNIALEDFTYSPYFEPIELCKIGTYQDKIFKGKGINLLPTGETFSGGANQWYDLYGNVMGTLDQIQANQNYIILKPNTTYKFFANTYSNIANMQIIYLDNTDTIKTYVNSAISTNVATFTTNTYTKIYVRVKATSSSNNTYFIGQLEEGTSASPYEPYNAKDKWLLHKEIGKVVLDGSESWGRGSGATTRSVFSLSTFTDRKTSNSLSDFWSDKFAYVGNAQSTDLGYAMSFNTGSYSNYLYIQVPTDIVPSGNVSSFETWLASNNTTVYYVLATPTNTEITNSELIKELDDFEHAVLNEGINHIIVDGNLPMYLDIDYWTYYKGETGKSIDSIIEEYALSTSSTSITGEWSTDIPTMTSTNKYLWNRETIVYKHPYSSETTDPIIIGVYGLKGDTGKGIASVTPLYYCSSSNTAPSKPTSHITTSSETAYNTWNIKCANYTTTYSYYYTCSEIKYSDNTYEWTDVVADQSVMFVNNLEIGGRNILVGTSNLNNTYVRNSGGTLSFGDTTDVSGKQNTVRLVSTGEHTCYIYFPDNLQINLPFKETGEYTFSFYAKANVATSVQTGIRVGNGGTERKTIPIGTTWTKCVHTFTNPSTSNINPTYVFIWNQEATTVDYCNFKLEKGIKPTDWTPAPEDVANDIVNVSNSLSNYVTTTTYDADWTNRKNEIYSYVGQTYTTTSQFGQYQETMQTALSQKADATTISATATQIVNSAISGISDTISNVEETFTFSTGGLEIARGGSTMSLLLGNDRLSFNNNGQEKMYMTSDSLVLYQLKRLQLGNYAFEVRTNGSIDFKKVK